MSQGTVVIDQGQTAKIRVQLIDGETNAPFNLAGLTGATGIFPLANNTGLAVTGILESEDLGTLIFNMDKDTTPTLNVGEGQSIEVRVDQGTTRSIAQLTNILTVNAPLFTSF